MKRQRGQVILLLILVMTVALAIGLSIVQKSLVDISTASKVEQSSRAFSAAEAGIEKALKGDPSCQDCQTFTDTSSSIKEITGTNLIPPVAAAGSRQVALEYPPLAKEDVAQVWLADYNSTSNPPTSHYSQTTLDIYWGNSSQDKAAIVLTLIYHDGTKYTSTKWYLDHASETRNNGFDKTTPCGGTSLPGYQCYKQIPLPAGMMLIRAKLLYNTTSQPFAVQAAVTCPTAPCTTYSLPSQAKEIISTGVSGETQRKVKVFLENKVVPHYFDYAIFSAGEISKQ